MVPKLLQASLKLLMLLFLIPFVFLAVACGGGGGGSNESPSHDVINISGVWDFNNDGSGCLTHGGVDTPYLVSGSGEATINQNGTSIVWYEPETGEKRSGTISGYQISVSGKFVLPLEPGVTITRNIYTASGTYSMTYINNRKYERIELDGTGDAAGSYQGTAWTATGSDQVVFTRDAPRELVSLAINGPTSVSDNSSTTYTATATWADGGTSTVTPTWSVFPTIYASINSSGVLHTLTVLTDETLSVSASYTANGVTRTADKVVTVNAGGFVSFGAPTIQVEGYKYLVLLDNSNGGKRYRAQVRVKDAAGNVLTNGALVKEMKVYDPTGTELAPDGDFLFWNGSGVHTDNGSGIVPDPMSDVELYLAAAEGSLSGGFYTAVVTDNNGNRHNAPLYFETPAQVGKPAGLTQTINADNSIRLSWTNPTGISAPAYLMHVYVFSDDTNGDGLNDHSLIAWRFAPASSYTIPASFVGNVLSGKTGLQWMVEIRQMTPVPVSFPGGGSSYAQFYRNRSALAGLVIP